MIILGLTGSIGMGKSTAAGMLRRFGVPVHDADAVVHQVTGRGGAAVPGIERAFAGVVVEGVVDRRALAQTVFQDPAALARLEAIIHPLVRRNERAFLVQAARRRRPVVALDIPLLLETGGADRVDAVIVVTAPAAMQWARVMRRPGMSAEKLRRILQQQMPDHEKRRRADFIVQTGLGRRFTQRQLQGILRLVTGRPGHCWPPRPLPRSKRTPHA